jgi:CMP-N,N'-diacetyllegionaminic acid synthase
MENKLKILAIVPARGGSKGLPKKNILPLNGIPLIGITINAAKKSKFIDRLILSTDCPEIAQVASQFNIENPFMRPPELATDTAFAPDNYEYTIKRMKDEFNYAADIVVILQPTSPMRTVNDIDTAIQLFLDKKADSVVSVCEPEHPVERMRKITDKGTLKNYLGDSVVLKNRQSYEKVYVPNGVVFVLDVQKFLQDKTYYWENTYPYLMSRENSTDIDHKIDFELATLLLKKRESQDNSS